ncbi:hypothetical protein TRFO_13273 [Tritrichomonas foetus]|uniref:Uncharacterized protein n=1 Tax=Tritrichomonas foetus TaxID=1144522 RepID=A0A1J4L2S0_9EUKA|nr:hypothetical protein TRFO_13273 [Tritrichomonas foetus]|eukprot:OHT16268.1 hypothetical protein TRFO_13273 [Tritrichomonas foetus]
MGYLYLIGSYIAGSFVYLVTGYLLPFFDSINGRPIPIGLMLQNEKPLETVGISNSFEDDVFLVADNHFSHIASFPLILPIIIFIIFALVSLFLPNSNNIQRQNFSLSEKEGSETFQVNNSILSVSPIYQFLSANFTLNEAQTDTNIRGTAKIWFLKNDDVVKYTENTFSSKSMTDPINLFNEHTINFDKVNIALSFTANAMKNQTYQLIIQSMEAVSSLSIFLCRVIFSLLLLPFLISLILRISDPNNYLRSEQLLTYFNTIFTIILCHPLYFLKLFIPSTLHDVFKILSRDLFFAYSIFYALSLYMILGKKPETSDSIVLSFPFVVMFVVFIILLWSDFQGNIIEYFQKTSSLTTSSTYVSDELGAPHYLVLLLAVNGIIALAFMVKNKITQSQSQRWKFYTFSISAICAILVIFAGIRLSFDNLNEAMCDILPMALFTAFAMIMEYGHQNTDSANDQEYQKAGAQAFDGDDIGFGIDEDPEQLAQPKPTANSTLEGN